MRSMILLVRDEDQHSEMHVSRLNAAYFPIKRPYDAAFWHTCFIALYTKPSGRPYPWFMHSAM